MVGSKYQKHTVFVVGKWHLVRRVGHTGGLCFGENAEKKGRSLPSDAACACMIRQYPSPAWRARSLAHAASEEERQKSRTSHTIRAGRFSWLCSIHRKLLRNEFGMACTRNCALNDSRRFQGIDQTLASEAALLHPSVLLSGGHACTTHTACTATMKVQEHIVLRGGN